MITKIKVPKNQNGDRVISGPFELLKYLQPLTCVIQPDGSMIVFYDGDS